MDAMIVNTTDTTSLNALITLALKQTIHAAVQAAIEDKLDNLDADTASVAASLGQRIAALDRFTAGLDRALVTSIGDQFSFNTQMQSRILALEKRLDTLSASAERTANTVENSTKALDVVLGRIQRGEGTLGKMSTDDVLYTNLNKTLESVNATSLEMKNLLADLKANPKKYLKVSVF